MSSLVVGVPVPTDSVELHASAGPLVSTAVMDDSAKRTIHHHSVKVMVKLVGFSDKIDTDNCYKKKKFSV